MRASLIRTQENDHSCHVIGMFIGCDGSTLARDRFDLLVVPAVENMWMSPQNKTLSGKIN